jgi:hypothetical protein
LAGKPNKKGAGRPVGSLSVRTKALRAISLDAMVAGEILPAREKYKEKVA